MHPSFLSVLSIVFLYSLFFLNTFCFFCVFCFFSLPFRRLIRTLFIGPKNPIGYLSRSIGIHVASTYGTGSRQIVVSRTGRAVVCKDFQDAFRCPCLLAGPDELHVSLQVIPEAARQRGHRLHGTLRGSGAGEGTTRFIILLVFVERKRGGFRDLATMDATIEKLSVFLSSGKYRKLCWIVAKSLDVLELAEHVTVYNVKE